MYRPPPPNKVWCGDITYIWAQDGTKCGRAGASAPRWIIANEEVKAALLLACEASPIGSRNLLHRAENYATFLQRTVLSARKILHMQGLKGFHELRAAYACERYQQLTGHAASVNGGHGNRIDRDLDQELASRSALRLAITEAMWSRLTLVTDHEKTF